MRFVLVAALSMFALSSYAETACDLPEDMCVAQEAFEAADAQMEQTLEAVETKIENNEFEDFMVEPADISESLELGQAAWSNYRDAHCAAVYRLMSGGTSRHEDELNCLTELTAARTAQLQSLYDVTADTVTDDDLSWLHGAWYESCSSSGFVFHFFVSSDGVFADTAPEGGFPADPSQMHRADILLGYDGVVEITPSGWDTGFLRIKSGGQGNLIGESYETVDGSTILIDEFELFQCPDNKSTDE
nr:lysozyme inhibitor LprI family protein [uncultured Hyphomonas sp.]